MKELKLENKILYIVLFIVINCLIIFLIYANTKLMGIDFNDSFWNPLSTFLGAFIGAIITGAIAIGINSRQNTLNELKEIRLVNNNYKKTFSLLKNWNFSFEDQLEGIIEDINSEKVKTHSIVHRLEIIKEYRQRLTKINHETIPIDVYEYFISLLIVVDNSEEATSTYLNVLGKKRSINAIINVSISETLEEYTVIFLKLKETYEKSYEKLEEYNNKLS